MKIVKVARPTTPKPKRLTPAERKEAKSLIARSDKVGLAKLMRENPTLSEQLMIDLLEQHEIPFAFQVVVIGYIPDFYLKQARAIIEVDGRIHIEQRHYDKERNQHFKDAGYGVFRVRESFLLRDPDRVAEELKGFIKNRKLTLKFGKLKKKVRDKKAAKNWRNVPKLNKNHLPKVKKQQF